MFSSFAPKSESKFHLSGSTSPIKRMMRKLDSDLELTRFNLGSAKSGQNFDGVMTTEDGLIITEEQISSWKEVKSEQVKKRVKILFFADRQVKIFENNWFAYYSLNTGKRKGLYPPSHIKEVSYESKDKMKFVTKNKTFLFKFNTPE